MLFEVCFVYSKKKEVWFYFKSNAIILQILRKLRVTSASLSRILHMYLSAEDQPHMHWITFFSK